MAGHRRIPRDCQRRRDQPQRDERQMRGGNLLVDPHAAPDASGRERDRQRGARAGEHGRRHAACRPQQHAGGEVAADVIHLADERDRRAEDQRAHPAREIGKIGPVHAIEQRAGPVGACNAGEQDRESCRPRDCGPVGGNERQEGGGDEQPADDRNHRRNIDGSGQRAQAAADCVSGGGGDHTIRLPAGEIGRQPLPVHSFEHGVASVRSRVDHTVTWVPISTTRSVGIWKKSEASLAERASAMNRRSCHSGMPEWGDGLSARRDRKNDVDMMSKVQPSLRAIASARGTFGVSMKP
jgi:hypothetical protein